MEKPSFISQYTYHIYNRGVEKRDVFLEKRDYLRFINDLHEFNDIRPAPPTNVRFQTRNPKTTQTTKLSRRLEVEPLNKKEPLVEILCFALMPNHYHILIRQLMDNGIVRFMQKLGTGYTMYFNQKRNRVGPLFQGRFKAVLVEKEAHFLYLPHYIHFNPLDLVSPDWRDKRIDDFHGAMTFLNSYRWSSYLDYTGTKNFPMVISPGFLQDIIGGPQIYKKAAMEWLREMDFSSIQRLLLE